MQNTQNLADFGQIEREEASTLLRTLGSLNDDTKHFQPQTLEKTTMTSVVKNMQTNQGWSDDPDPTP